MNGNLLKTLSLILLTLVILNTVCSAQKGTSVVRRINFQRGKSTAVVRGTVRRGVSHDYLLRARRGQDMSVTLTSKGEVGFEILTPSRSNLSGFTQDWNGSLPESGDYRINVLPPTSTNAPVSYMLEVTIR